MSNLNLYCVRCRSKTNNDKPTVSKSKNGRILLKAKCSNCGIQKTQFTSQAAAQKGGFLPFLLPLLGGVLAGKALSG